MLNSGRVRRAKLLIEFVEKLPECPVFHSPAKRLIDSRIKVPISVFQHVHHIGIKKDSHTHGRMLARSGGVVTKSGRKSA